MGETLQIDVTAYRRLIDAIRHMNTALKVLHIDSVRARGELMAGHELVAGILDVEKTHEVGREGV